MFASEMWRGFLFLVLPVRDRLLVPTVWGKSSNVIAIFRVGSAEGANSERGTACAMAASPVGDG